MSWPKPEQGQVIRYSFLWSHEAQQGKEEGSKDRPCAIILVILREDERPLVRVLPITHAAPNDPEGALEIPHLTKLRLGLDSERSWVVHDEANDFVCPGPDLRPATIGNLSTVIYGFLPPGFVHELKKRLVSRRRQLRGRLVRRTE